MLSFNHHAPIYPKKGLLVIKRLHCEATIIINIIIMIKLYGYVFQVVISRTRENIFSFVCRIELLYLLINFSFIFHRLAQLSSFAHTLQSTELASVGLPDFPIHNLVDIVRIMVITEKTLYTHYVCVIYFLFDD